MDAQTLPWPQVAEVGAKPLLEVRDLQTHFGTPDGVVRAVEGLSFHIDAGETVAIVGESGCGKSVTSMSILRLVPTPPGKIAGQILFQGRDLLAVPDSEMRKLRGNDISMIFQEPMTSLNPVLTVGRQIGETLRLHQGMNQAQAIKRSTEMLELVGISAAARRVHEFPHSFFSREAPIYTRPRFLPASKINGVSIRNAIISDGCILTDARLERCVIGIRSVINSGAELRDVVLMGADYYEGDPRGTTLPLPENAPPIGIGRNCVIKRAIIDKNARIGDGVVITPEGKPDNYDSENFYIRDGVVVIPKNAVLTSGSWV